jgi:hypothetical protein
MPAVPFFKQIQATQFLSLLSFLKHQASESRYTSLPSANMAQGIVHNAKPTSAFIVSCQVGVALAYTDSVVAAKLAVSIAKIKLVSLALGNQMFEHPASFLSWSPGAHSVAACLQSLSYRFSLITSFASAENVDQKWKEDGRFVAP